MQRLGRANLGSPRHLRDHDGLRVSTTVYAGASALPTHEHDHAYLCLVADGAYQQRVTGHDGDCARGLLLVHPEGHRHANRFSAAGARCLSVFLPPGLAAGSGLRRLLGDYRRLRLPDAGALVARIERELAANDEAAGLALQSAVLDLVARACRLEPEDTRPAWLLRVIDRLRDDPRSMPSLTELARLAGVHPAHLARRFQQAQGMSVGQYHRALRVGLAREALHDPARSIAGIAADAGFADQSHFARVFKRIIGQTPGAYRRDCKTRAPGQGAF